MKFHSVKYLAAMFAVLAIFSMIIIVATLVTCSKARFEAHLAGCKQNLIRVSIGLAMYKQDFGRNIYYPMLNGSPFLVKPYTVGIIGDPKVYLCPATKDTNNDTLLRAVVEGDPQNVCSYAGRKNRTQGKYPGIIMRQGLSNQGTAADDIDQPTRSGENHYPIVTYADRDGRIDQENLENEHDAKFIKEIRDPLTN